MSAPTPPELPSLTNKSTFFALAQGLFVWLTTTFMQWVDSVSTAMNFNSTNDTSTSSVLIGTGSKSFTVSLNKSYLPGMWVIIADTAAPSTNSMVAQITSYAIGTGALVVNVPTNGVLGSGTKAAWTISQTAKPSGEISGAMLPVVQAASVAAARVVLDVPANAEVVHAGYMQIQDQKASGTSGGASTATAITRTLNTVVSNTISGASLASNVITLPAGTYRVRAESMAVADTTASHITPFLQNTTDSVKALTGLRSYTGVGMSANPSVNGRFTIAATKNFTLINQYSSANANGLGLPASFGYVEIYSNVEIWKE